MRDLPPRPWRHGRSALKSMFVAALLAYAVWPWVPMPGRAAPRRTLVVYGFSILGEVMNADIVPAFEAEWAARTGESVEVITSFGGSGTITNQIIMGVPADVAVLSLELDALRLAEAGVVRSGAWRALPHRGVVNRTPFVIVVRPGNPKGIHDFADLARPGVRVVHPDPLTSGGANWAILAEYGAGARAAGGDPAAGRALLEGIWRNVVAQSPSARAARTQFENGFGDALITYEQEAVHDRASGRLAADIVYPGRTILSEHTVVRIDRNVDAAERDLADAFVAYLWSPDAQRRFGSAGFRSVDEGVNAVHPDFASIADAFTIDAFGGWPRAKREIIDAVWRDEVLVELGR